MYMYVNSDVLGMRQIFLETGLQSWPKANFVALVLLSSSRACEYHSCMFTEMMFYARSFLNLGMVLAIT